MSTPQRMPFRLRSIYIRTSQIEMADEFDPVLPNQALLGQFRLLDDSSVDCREAQLQGADQIIRSCSFMTSFEFRYVRPLEDGREPGPEDRPVARLTATICCDYLLESDAFPENDHLVRFGKTNALVHAWPYWREYCQNTITRMNLPVTTIPLLELQQAAPEQDASAPDGNAER